LVWLRAIDEESQRRAVRSLAERYGVDCAPSAARR